MNIMDYIYKTEDKPLDNMVLNGGYCGIFRRIACIGDSLSSGEFEALQNGLIGYHDFYEYSWGQYIARDIGCDVYNFSRGGMTAEEYCESFAELKGYWSEEYAVQAYIIALGVNDITRIINGELEMGSIQDVDLSNCGRNKHTFLGYYAQIIQHYKVLQPKAKFFLMTIPKSDEEENRKTLGDIHRKLIYQLSQLLENCYVLDFRKYAPDYNKEFQQRFFLGGHLSPAGYRLTALMTESYIDYIIRNNMEDFKQVGFIGTPYYNEKEKW